MPDDDIDISAEIVAPVEEPVNEGVEESPVEYASAPEPVPEPVVEETYVPGPEPSPEYVVEEPAYEEPAGPKTMNRWIVVVGALLIQLALGAIYSWSVFTPYLTGKTGDYGFNFSESQTQMIFSAGLLVFALVMVLSGRLLTKHSPRKIAVIGGLVLGAGYMAASLMDTSFLGLFITIGIIGGAGIGMAYVVPIAVCMKWFPDKKGLISGIAVAGFGFGATIWVKMAGSWGSLIDSTGIHTTFFIYGVVFLLMVVLGGLLMINPPAGFSPKGWTPPAPTKSGPSGYNYTPKKMFRHRPAKRQFYMIWSMFIFGALAGLMVIGIIKSFGIDALEASGYDAVEASAIAGTAMAVFYAIFNGVGRIVWGAVADKIGVKKSLMAMFAFQAVMMFIVFGMGGNEYTLYIAAALIGFNFGGNFSLFPTTTAEFFGTKTVGQNYGYMFTAYGVGGVVGPLMAGYFKDSAGGVEGWYPAFIIAGILCVVAVILAIMLKAPRPPRSRRKIRK